MSKGILVRVNYLKSIYSHESMVSGIQLESPHGGGGQATWNAQKFVDAPGAFGAWVQYTIGTHRLHLYNRRTV